jgi:hypothetical protein
VQINVIEHEGCGQHQRDGVGVGDALARDVGRHAQPARKRLAQSAAMLPSV